MIRVFALVSAAFLLVAPQAHADPQSYIPDLQAAGVPSLYGAQDPRMGNYICDTLHNGATPDFIPILRPWAPTITSTAQRDICPDTLH